MSEFRALSTYREKYAYLRTLPIPEYREVALQTNLAPLIQTVINLGDGEQLTSDELAAISGWISGILEFHWAKHILRGHRYSMRNRWHKVRIDSMNRLSFENGFTAGKRQSNDRHRLSAQKSFKAGLKAGLEAATKESTL